MGANSSKAIENVTSKISTELSQTAGSSSTASCSIQNGNIILRNANGCSVTNKNQCGATATAALSSISKAAADAWAEATNEQKTSILPGINVSSTKQEVQTFIENKLSQTCQANSSTTLSIANKDTIIDGCTNSTINNINSGDAQANCGIVSIMDSITQGYAKNDTGQTTGDLFGSLFGWLSNLGSVGILGCGAISVCCLCICCLFIIAVIASLFMSGST